MNGRSLLPVALAVLLGCGIAVFFALGGLDLLNARKKQETRRAHIIIPGENGTDSYGSDPTEQFAFLELENARTALGEGEIPVAMISHDFNLDSIEDQIVAYRNVQEMDSPICIAYVEFDERNRTYRRIWSTETAASRSGTVSLYTADLIGDRSVCVILSGINEQGEHTMTVFRWNGQNNRQQQTGRGRGALTNGNQPLLLFAKIAEMRIDGLIKVQETERSQAYQLGISNGQSYDITAYGHDPASANILDQLEITYVYNPQNEVYERTRFTRIPGSQIEQRRLRELLSGTPGVFEDFINGLWYYVSPEGTIDNRQYLYFDYANKEIIFYGDEAQQIFTWRNSTTTRYGLYINSQNISVSTMRRSLNIELESLESIRVRVVEDVRLKILISESWDGSYRRAGAETAANTGQGEQALKPYIDAAYDSSLGRLRFYPDGKYEINPGAVSKTGWYVFFRANGEELLELRASGTGRDAKSEDADQRQVYRVERARRAGPETLNLFRVRLGSGGIEELHEGVITLVPLGQY